MELAQLGVYRSGARIDGNQKLACEMTLREGKVVYDLNGITRPRWEPSTPDVGAGDPRWDGLNPQCPPRRGPTP